MSNASIGLYLKGGLIGEMALMRDLREPSEKKMELPVKHADKASKTVVLGNIGALPTNEGETDGYFIVALKSGPYTLREDVICV